MSRGKGQPHLPVAPDEPHLIAERTPWPPRTVADLERHWSLRDHRYDLRRSQLSEAEKAAIRIARRADVLALPASQQLVGQRMLQRSGWA